MPEYRNSWDVISGTSIGALNAGILAQFPPERQCSEGLAALEEYWTSIESVNDVWRATDVPGRLDVFGRKRPCLDPSNIVACGYGFVRHGGFCDPAPGSERYRGAVSAERIRSSGMGLRVTAASLQTGEPHVFTEQSDDIVDGCMASGSIAPLVYPKRVGDDIFVDGGIYHNTPLLRTLDGTESVTSVLVVELSPLDTPPKLKPRSGGEDVSEISGFDVLEYYLQALYVSVTDRRELRDACTYFPSVEIRAVIPERPVGSLIAFNRTAIGSMMRAGLEFVRREGGPQDVCRLLGVQRRRFSVARLLGVGSPWRPGGSGAAAFAMPGGGGVQLGTLVATALAAFAAGRATAPGGARRSAPRPALRAARSC